LLPTQTKTINQINQPKNHKAMKKLNLYQVNTTAWDEEDFLLLTDLSEEQVTEIIQPIVEAERERENALFEGDNPPPAYWSDLISEYTNETLVEAIREKYPNAIVTAYDPTNIDLISV